MPFPIMEVASAILESELRTHPVFRGMPYERMGDVVQRVMHRPERRMEADWRQDALRAAEAVARELDRLGWKGPNA